MRSCSKKEPDFLKVVLTVLRHFSLRFLILGDINGEIHLINVENLDIPSGESYRDLKPSDITTLRSHGYRKR